MSIQHTTIEGDVLDYLCWKYYGSTSGRIVETVLEANMGLADNGPTMAAGIVIQFPDIQATASTDNRTYALWE